MKSARPDRPEDDLYDPVAFHHAASKLDVYRHERLAYTDIPARQPKSQRPASDRMKKFFTAVYCWVIARG